MEQKICRFDEIPDSGCKEFICSINNQPQDAFLVRRNSQLYAYLNRCPHTGVNLNWHPDQFLNYDGDFLQCSMHGALFEIDSGRCIHGPCLGQSLSALVVELRDEEVYCCAAQT